MVNLSIKLNLLALPGASVANLKGKTATKQCLVIPIADADLYVGQKGCYLNLTAVETQNSQYGDTHFVRQNLSKDAYAALTEEQRKAIPILGNVKPQVFQQQTVPQNFVEAAQFVDGEENLPF